MTRLKISAITVNATLITILLVQISMLSCTNNDAEVRNPSTVNAGNQIDINSFDIQQNQAGEANPESDINSVVVMEGSEIPSRYGYTSDFQARLDQLSVMQSFCHIETEAFYRQNRRMPSSWNELENTDWVLLMPIPMNYSPGLNIVERPLGSVHTDLNTIQIVFNPLGFDFLCYMQNTIEAVEAVDEQYRIISFGTSDYARALDAHYGEFSSGSRLIDTNTVNIRISLMKRICKRLMVDYWIYHQDFPNTFTELLDDKWVPYEEKIFNLETIPTGDEGWFYFGVSPENNICYFEYILTKTPPIIEQVVYIIDDALTVESGEIGREICTGSSEGITRDNTTPIIDASVLNWGLMD